jgi:hypothetical protein
VNYSNDEIARVVHESQRALQYIQGDPNPAPPWDAADWEMQLSCIAGVQSARNGASPELLHQDWLARKLNDGWRFGQVKDAQAKTHPCMVLYADLPEHQKEKDRLFTAIVRTMTGMRQS